MDEILGAGLLEEVVERAGAGAGFRDAAGDPAAGAGEALGGLDQGHAGSGEFGDLGRGIAGGFRALGGGAGLGEGALLPVAVEADEAVGEAFQAEPEEGPDGAREVREVAVGGHDPTEFRAGPDRACGRAYDRGCARDDAAQALDQAGDEEG